MPVGSGLDVLTAQVPNFLEDRKIGLIANHASVNSELTNIIDIFINNPKLRLTALFSPEHGFRGDAQAGVGISSNRDNKTGLPVHSLYGETVKPTPEMLTDIDILVLDLQDVGSRYWTYLSTMTYCLRAVAEKGIPFVVLDRPNPIGGAVTEGNILDRNFTSMVGCHPLPMRTGITMGEAAMLIKASLGDAVELHVIKAEGWRRDVWFDETGLPYVPPSPNMPTLDTMTLYPGTCLVEGTNLSEGRGTTKPFELIGAPWLDAEKLAESLNALELPGVRFRPAYFTPHFSKHREILCRGVQVHVLSRKKVKAVETGLSVICAARSQKPDNFRWAGFEMDQKQSAPLFFDLLSGGTELRRQIESGFEPKAIAAAWSAGLSDYERTRKDFLLYE